MSFVWKIMEAQHYWDYRRLYFEQLLLVSAALYVSYINTVSEWCLALAGLVLWTDCCFWPVSVIEGVRLFFRWGSAFPSLWWQTFGAVVFLFSCDVKMLEQINFGSNAQRHKPCQSKEGGTKPPSPIPPPLSLHNPIMCSNDLSVSISVLVMPTSRHEPDRPMGSLPAD